jgi:hypothetical protein
MVVDEFDRYERRSACDRVSAERKYPTKFNECSACRIDKFRRIWGVRGSIDACQ